VLDIFEHSFHFADSLLRYPELLDEIGQPLQLEANRWKRPSGAALLPRQMLRIQGESILEAAPIFATLARLRRWRQGDRRGLPHRPHRSAAPASASYTPRTR